MFNLLIEDISHTKRNLKIISPWFQVGQGLASISTEVPEVDILVIADQMLWPATVA
jgi:hypothetical protein